MRRAFAIAALLSFAATPGLAQPGQSFTALCLATGGSVKAVTAAARAAGWTVISELSDEQAARTLASPRGAPSETLMLNTVQDGPFVTDFCTVVTDGDLAAAETAIQAAVGFAPKRLKGGAPAWVFTRAEDGRYHAQDDLAGDDVEEEALFEAVADRGPIASVSVQPVMGLTLTHALTHR